MQLIRQLPLRHDRPTAVAIGNFDGLHLGHQSVIAAMREAAARDGAVPSVLTFEPHPRKFFAAGMPAFRLERLSAKLMRLREAGVTRCYMPQFNARFAALSAEDFLNDVLAGQLGARTVVTGENFAFGKNRGGDVTSLRAWGAAHGVAIVSVPAVAVDGVTCSSSAVRKALGEGDVAQAALLLGRAYTLSGRVVHGDGRGKTIGFATANIALPPQLKLPAHGVYAVRVRVNGRGHDGVANLGVRPTVSVENISSLEVHLFETKDDFYGRTMEVAFVQKLRDERKFDGLAALVAQIQADCQQARTLLGTPVA